MGVLGVSRTGSRFQSYKS